VVVLAVNAWNEPRDRVQAFVKEMGINYPVLLQGSGAAGSYGADRGIPVTVHIDAQGRIASRQVGFETEAQKEANLKKARGGGN
jgi:hypothetical protein